MFSSFFRNEPLVHVRRSALLFLWTLWISIHSEQWALSNVHSSIPTRSVPGKVHNSVTQQRVWNILQCLGFSRRCFLEYEAIGLRSFKFLLGEDLCRAFFYLVGILVLRYVRFSLVFIVLNFSCVVLHSFAYQNVVSLVSGDLHKGACMSKSQSSNEVYIWIRHTKLWYNHISGTSRNSFVIELVPRDGDMFVVNLKGHKSGGIKLSITPTSSRNVFVHQSFSWRLNNPENVHLPCQHPIRKLL